MRINISEDAMGYRLKLGGSKDDFETLLANLKAGIPANCRKFTEGRWFVHRRAARDVERFCDLMRSHYNATIERGGVERGIPEDPQPLMIQIAPASDEPVSKSVIESLLRLSLLNSYLSISAGQESAELLHSTDRRRKGEPSIVLNKSGRWFSFSAHCFGLVLTDAARNRAFEILLAASLPGGSVRASNRDVTASRLPFGVGVQITQALTVLMFDERSREQGSGREHCRWQAEKRADGEIKYLQRGQDKRDDKRAA